MGLWQKMMISLARQGALRDFIQKRASLSELAIQFVGGKNETDASKTCLNLSDKGIYSSMFYLGEYVDDPSVVNETVLSLKRMISGMSQKKQDIHISVDPTQIGLRQGEAHFIKNSIKLAKKIEASILYASSGHMLMLDMEDAGVTETTLSMHDKLMEKSLPAAVTLQACLYRTEEDLLKIIRSGGCVRLVKGAFAEKNTIAYTGKKEIDNRYLELAGLMLSEKAFKTNFYPVFGTHDDHLIDLIISMANKNGFPKRGYEFEMLYGVRKKLQQDLIRRGEKLRLYMPYGTEWWPYAVRRIGENPKNIKFLLKTIYSKNL